MTASDVYVCKLCIEFIPASDEFPMLLVWRHTCRHTRRAPSKNKNCFVFAAGKELLCLPQAKSSYVCRRQRAVVFAAGKKQLYLPQAKSSYVCRRQRAVVFAAGKKL